MYKNINFGHADNGFKINFSKKEDTPAGDTYAAPAYAYKEEVFNDEEDALDRFMELGGKLSKRQMAKIKAQESQGGNIV